MANEQVSRVVARTRGYGKKSEVNLRVPEFWVGKPEKYLRVRWRAFV
jgi:hypothetical protein